MKVQELISHVFDSVVLYRREGEDYIDLFKGKSSEIPTRYLELEVGIIGAKRKNILDIEVR